VNYFFDLDRMVTKINTLLLGVNIEFLIVDINLFIMFSNNDFLDWDVLFNKTHFNIFYVNMPDIFFNLDLGMVNIDRTWLRAFMDFHSVNWIIAEVFTNVLIIERNVLDIWHDIQFVLFDWHWNFLFDRDNCVACNFYSLVIINHLNEMILDIYRANFVLNFDKVMNNRLFLSTCLNTEFCLADFFYNRLVNDADFTLSDCFWDLLVLFDFMDNVVYADSFDNIWHWSSNVLLDNMLDVVWLVIVNFVWLIDVFNHHLLVGIFNVFVNNFSSNLMLGISVFRLRNIGLLHPFDSFVDDRLFLRHILRFLISSNMRM